MSRRAAILTATAAALAVGLISYFWTSGMPAGLATATRNTARLSGVVFALALAARSARFDRWFANRWNLFWAFIAAHGVHFSAVAALAVLDVQHPLHQVNVANTIILAGGFGIVLAAALTAGSVDAPFRSRMHSFFFYFIGASFLSAFSPRALTSPASAVALVCVLAALVLRAAPVRRSVTPSASA